jgi:hypothetical protein
MIKMTESAYFVNYAAGQLSHTPQIFFPCGDSMI